MAVASEWDGLLSALVVEVNVTAVWLECHWHLKFMIASNVKFDVLHLVGKWAFICKASEGFWAVNLDWECIMFAFQKGKEVDFLSFNVDWDSAWLSSNTMNLDIARWAN